MASAESCDGCSNWIFPSQEALLLGRGPLISSLRTRGDRAEVRFTYAPVHNSELQASDSNHTISTVRMSLELFRGGKL